MCDRCGGMDVVWYQLGGVVSPLEVVLPLEVVPLVGVMPLLEVAPVSEAEPPLEVESPVAVVPPLEVAGGPVTGTMVYVALLLNVEA